MDWFVLALISVTTLSISNLLQRALMREETSDFVAYATVFQLFSGVLVLLYALASGFVLPPMEKLPLNFLFVALFWGGGTLFLFKSLKTTEVSEVAILLTTRTLWVIPVAFLFLGETYDLRKAMGALLVVASVLLITQQKGRFEFHKGSVFALVASCLYGFALANDTFIIRSLNPEIASYTSMAFLLPGIAILVGSSVLTPKALLTAKSLLALNTLRKMVVLSIVHTASAVTFYLALQRGGNISQLTPIGQSSIILTVLLAAAFLGERAHLLKKLISAVIVSVGVLLLK